MQPTASLHTKICAEVTQVKGDGKIIPTKNTTEQKVVQRMAVGVRHAGDDGSAAFRIPGLVTTNKGTLLEYTMCVTTAV